jgi:acyl carrier protein
LDTKEHMFQAGYLDSLGLFRLIFDVESEFGVELDQNRLFSSGATDIDALSEVMSHCVLSESN